jgi:hypothetical protein
MSAVLSRNLRLPIVRSLATFEPAISCEAPQRSIQPARLIETVPLALARLPAAGANIGALPITCGSRGEKATR